MAPQPTVVKFFAPVIDATINTLMQAVDQKLAAGQRNFIILVSSPGGSVFHGLSAYNYLKGLPADISTHNFGSVDSIGVILYCAGRNRLCVPQARFVSRSLRMDSSCGMGPAQPNVAGRKLPALLRKRR